MDLMTGVALGNKYWAEGAERALQKTEEALNLALNAIERYKVVQVTLERDLAIANADAQARLAQVEALKVQHPNSPLLGDSEERYTSAGTLQGKRKNKLRLIYEKTFDRIADGRGIKSPKNFRIN
jgi:hypothetical protein